MVREKLTIKRKPIGIRLNPQLVKTLKMIALEKEIQVNLLLEEAIQDLINKYKESPSDNQ